MAERESLTADRPALAIEVEFAIGALRSNNDVLLHKTPRTEVVNEQLVLNRNAIGRLKAALMEEGIRVN